MTIMIPAYIRLLTHIQLDEVMKKLAKYEYKIWLMRLLLIQFKTETQLKTLNLWTFHFYFIPITVDAA